MAEEVAQSNFNLDAFLKSLGRDEFSPGHSQPGGLKEEVKSRVTNLVVRAGIMEMTGTKPETVNDLKTRGIHTILKRFPENKDLIINLFREREGYEKQVEEITNSPEK